ncbi:RagB/SusD family nutrient uptake outer membrane protein [[Flexibacter] sp. ATCC 35103]|uniref:RagB/SusD family nutrient uptake outer membrane protein n=1 Tax=[Flexibacter] sp. ATCC 35103 TaxID=1937528 RepID=UPI0021011D68|nr:RagB/SusD family nutrient uptake outer membrane protein [[Flexibacter] sp. ATCC 35103]
MKNLITKLLYLAGFLLLLISCDSFVETDLPKSQLNNEAVFEDYATATAALTDIYSKIRDNGMLNGNGIPVQLGSYTDETDSFQSPSSPSEAFYQNRLLPSSPTIQDWWNVAYNQIYAANSLIEGVQNSKNLSEQNKKQLQGEALFIRALIHFYLVNLFGDIPYVVETDYRNNSKIPRTSTQNIYNNLIADLQNASSMLPETYSPAQRVRPNKFTARALLARVYLYNNQFTEAANEASAVLNQTGLFSLEPDLDQVFLINSRETIWQLQSANAGENTVEGSIFIFVSGPPVLALTENFVNSFSDTDLRKSNWINSVTDDSTIWYHAFKYKERSNTPASVEYSVQFRLAEQYLIRAEARAHLGNLGGAREDLNKIRERAGLGQTTAQSQTEILNAILQERRWELFSEPGHRFFDLKRFGQLDNILSAVKPGWNSEDRIFPIPQNELNANPNLLPQNPGY